MATSGGMEEEELEGKYDDAEFIEAATFHGAPPPQKKLGNGKYKEMSYSSESSTVNSAKKEKTDPMIP